MNTQYNPPIVESVDDPDVCEDHGVEMRWYDDGSMESGPGEPYLDCPTCRRERGPQCPECGAYEDEGYEVTSKPTRMYGGGYDTFYHCKRCGYTDVAT